MEFFRYCTILTPIIHWKEIHDWPARTFFTKRTRTNTTETEASRAGRVVRFRVCLNEIFALVTRWHSIWQHTLSGGSADCAVGSIFIFFEIEQFFFWTFVVASHRVASIVFFEIVSPGLNSNSFHPITPSETLWKLK